MPRASGHGARSASRSSARSCLRSRVLAASMMHANLFDPRSASVWLWFGGFGSAAPWRSLAIARVRLRRCAAVRPDRASAQARSRSLGSMPSGWGKPFRCRCASRRRRGSAKVAVRRPSRGLPAWRCRRHDDQPDARYTWIASIGLFLQGTITPCIAAHRAACPGRRSRQSLPDASSADDPQPFAAANCERADRLRDAALRRPAGPRRFALGFGLFYVALAMVGALSGQPLGIVCSRSTIPSTRRSAASGCIAVVAEGISSQCALRERRMTSQTGSVIRSRPWSDLRLSMLLRSGSASRSDSA